MSGSERGSVAVELGMVLPIIALLIGGLVSFGFVYTVQLTMQQAAREGARAGALGEDVGAAVHAAAVGIPAGLSVRTSGPCDPSDPSQVGTQVSVVLDLELTLPVPVIDHAVPLTARAVMRCGG